MDILVISGFLGAGITTFIKEIIKKPIEIIVFWKMSMELSILIAPL